MTKNLLRESIHNSLLSLIAEEGIYASGKEEVYGCIFGRDSAITVLKILKALSNRSRMFTINELEFLAASRRTLITLASLAGKTFNPDSGEEPGKFVHEFRKFGYERLVNRPRPWYVYPDGFLRNYDSIDSTPLGLIAIYKFFKKTNDREFLDHVISSVENGLLWIMTHADRDEDFLLEYDIPKERTHGGLTVHSWTDSHESLTRPDGTFPSYPIAPVEVQGYAWFALKVWEKFFSENPEFSKISDFNLILRNHARLLKKSFNRYFIFQSEGLYYAAQALDGGKRRIQTITGNPLLLLWASYRKNGKTHSIIDDSYVAHFVKRAFMPDLFDPDAGIRTMSTKSETFDPSENSYHNGSFWPKLNGMVHEGLVAWKFYAEARKLKNATIGPIKFFGTPIELYIKNDKGKLVEFKSNSGQVSCRNQAWSAAAVLDLLTERRVAR
jgi:glycogen debranching enzyme